MSLAALSPTREGYKHQLDQLNTAYLELLTHSRKLLDFIFASKFLSQFEADYSEFMQLVSTVVSCLVASPAFAGIFPSVAGQLPGLGLNVAAAPAAVAEAETRQGEKYPLPRFIIAGGIVILTYSLLMSGFWQPEMFFVSSVIASLIGAGPEIAQILARKMPPLEEAKVKAPQTFESLVVQELGMGPEGMRRRFRGAYLRCKHESARRSFFQTKYRAEFPDKIDRLIAHARVAVDYQRAELNRLMMEVTREAPPRPRGAPTHG